MNELHLFAGAGGGILGGQILGHTCVCAVEINEYARNVLLQRQRDGLLPRFPIWDDVCTFDGRDWRGRVDVVCGGFPCTDIASCGKGAGIEGKESSLWREMARIIGEVRPKYAFIENSPMLTVRGLDRVLCDLTEMGYDTRWCVMGSRDFGKTNRDRIWILGKSNGYGLEGFDVYESPMLEKQIRSATKQVYDTISKVNRRLPKSIDVRMVDGFPDWMDRFRAAGMAQNPFVAARAFTLLMGSEIKGGKLVEGEE